MTSASKRKGNGFERELVDSARKVGLEAKRAWGSNGEALGYTQDVDLLVGEWRVQAKRRKELPAWLGMSDTVDAVAIRPDRGEAFILLRWADWLEMLDHLRQV